MKRTLVLRRERLADLTTGDLAAVAGGARTELDCPGTTYVCVTGTTFYCVTGWALCRSAVTCS